MNREKWSGRPRTTAPIGTQRHPEAVNSVKVVPVGAGGAGSRGVGVAFFDARAFLDGLFQADTEDATADIEPEPTIIPDDLPTEWYDHWVERAAIREYDGGQAREHAEAEALRETIEAMRARETI